MRKIALLLCTVGFALLAPAQDFTNKGKEFWLCFPSHTPSGSAIARMSLFITSDKNSSGNVSIGGNSFRTFNVTANTVTEIDIPYNTAHINFGESGSVVRKGIHVKVDQGRPAVVVYAHLYAGFRSAASLILPTSVLGKKYYSMNAFQLSTAGSKSQFQVVAVDTNSVVQITLVRNGLVQPAFSVTLPLPGDIYQHQDDLDLTGSYIESVSIAGPGGGCKKIAVFSGSSAVTINNNTLCTGSASYDPLYQQLYPVNTWGKNFAFVPFEGYPVGNPFRVLASEDNTQVFVNGVLVTTLMQGQHYPTTDPNPVPLNQSVFITADKPVSVAQYMQRAGCRGANPNDIGDPDMVILNPIEQSINNITVFSSNLQNISPSGKYIQVVMRQNATGSFRINGAAAPNNWQTIAPFTAGFVFNRIPLTDNAPSYTLTCDSGFNALAYGLGNFESYAYSAGTNVRDLYQYVIINNDSATVDFPAACKGSPFKFSIVFPYQPTSISWKFYGLFNDTTITTPVYDSSWIINNRTVYRYKLNRTYLISTSGTYPITVTVNNPTGDGCSGEQDIDYDLQVFDPPTSDFSFQHNGCTSDSVRFFDNTNGNGRPIIRWYWTLGDGNTSQLANPAHKYNVAGNLTVRHSAITDVGCLSDTSTKIIAITDPPIAAYGISSPACVNGNIQFTDVSTISSGTLVKWTWNFGDGAIIVATNGNPVQHAYASAGTYTATLEVESSTGCRSPLFSRIITIHPKPMVNFNLPGNVCLPSGIGQFTDLSTIADGTQALFAFAWDFGDGAVSNQKNPVHQFSAVGPFNIKLRVVSNNGCIDSTIKLLNTIYSQPRADFSVTQEVCINDTTRFTDLSNGQGSQVTRWRWQFGDGATDSVPNPIHRYPNPNAYVASLFIYTDKGCISDTITKTTVVHPAPTPAFNSSIPACINQAITFTDVSVPNVGTITRWTWSFGNGNSSIIQNPSTSYTAPGSYPVTLVVENSEGCKSIVLSRPIIVNHLPEADFLTPEVCLSDPFAQFNDNSTIADGSQAQFTYLWNFADPNASGGNPNSSTLKNPQHRYTAVGNYNVSLTVTSRDGCVQSVTKPFTVNGSVPLAGFSVNNPASLCSNQPVRVTDASSVDFGSIVKVEIYWDYTSDPTIKTVEDNPVIGQVYTHTYPDFGTPSTRTFQVRYVVYSGINCVNEITRNITVNASPRIQFDPIAAVCEELPPFVITTAREVYGFQGTGLFSGSGIVSPANGTFSPEVAKDGMHTIRYSFTATNGCQAFAEQTINVHPTPEIDAGPDRNVLEGGFVIIQAKASGNSLQYLWSPPSGIENNTVLTPKVSPLEDITYTLQATSADGCVATDPVFVKVLKTPKIPNAFSPNGDGINDKWVIQYLESYPGCTVEVFNRYGQKIFNSVGYGQPWDGTLGGVPVPVGVYYWIINPKNGRQQMNGSVTVIR